MDEQPVAFAIRVRSPNSCESSLTYGVSPQPAHAPENSNRGSSSCEFLMVLGLNNVRSASGSARKYSQLAASVSRKSGCGAMLRALRPAWDLSLTGQVSTHRVQPVQSSGATCTVYFISGNSLNLESMDLNVAGASLSRSPAYTLWRMTACGQTKTHLPHWMHRSGSQTGMSSE